MQADVLRAPVIRSVVQPFAMMKSFTGLFCGGRPPLAIDSLVRREARLPHLPN
jgi:hypothetical protein